MPEHLALPLQLQGGRLAALQQDHPLEVAQSVALLIATRPGERRVLPDYGISDPVFGGIDPDEITDAILEWDPRVEGRAIDTLVDGFLEQGTVWVESVVPSAVVWPEAIAAAADELDGSIA